MRPVMVELEDRIAGLLLGLALGDALGLPFEGMSGRRIARSLGLHPHSLIVAVGEKMINHHVARKVDLLLPILAHLDAAGEALVGSRLTGFPVGTPKLQIVHRTQVYELSKGEFLLVTKR